MPVMAAARVVLPDRVIGPAVVEVDDDGRIGAVSPTSGVVPDRILVPGLIDVQVNGHDDVDVAAAHGSDWDRLDELLVSQGVTAWCPTLVTAPLDRYAAPLARLADAAGRAGPRPEILGAHLEGPFLGDRPGAHPTELIVPVDRPWLDALPPSIALITVAPECPGAREALAWALERGVVLALGHSGATAAEVTAVVDAGARLVTHLFNGMSGVDHRAPGVAVAALVDDRVSASVIADLVHVHPDVIRLAFRCKPRGTTILVTDAVAWRAGRVGMLGISHDGTAPRLDDGTIAGSSLTMDRAVANVVERCGVELVDAVFAAATAPADLLGRSDLGRITAGSRADLTALSPELACDATWIAGRQVFDR